MRVVRHVVLSMISSITVHRTVAREAIVTAKFRASEHWCRRHTWHSFGLRPEGMFVFVRLVQNVHGVHLIGLVGTPHSFIVVVIIKGAHLILCTVVSRLLEEDWKRSCCSGGGSLSQIVLFLPHLKVMWADGHV